VDTLFRFTQELSPEVVTPSGPTMSAVSYVPRPLPRVPAVNDPDTDAAQRSLVFPTRLYLSKCDD
jgi:hypothetical protein